MSWRTTHPESQQNSMVARFIQFLLYTNIQWMLQLKQHPSIHKQINMLLIYVVVIEWTGHIKIMSGLIKPLQLSRHERHVVPYLYHLIYTLRWRHNGRDSVSNHQPRDCLLNRLFRRRSKKRLKLRVTGHCAGNSPWTGEFPAQMASNAENVSIWWRHHAACLFRRRTNIKPLCLLSPFPHNFLSSWKAFSCHDIMMRYWTLRTLKHWVFLM